MELTKWHPDFATLRFVARATTTPKDMRGALEYVNVETKDDKRYIYGADGFRLHIGECEVLDDGMYKVTKNTASSVCVEPVTDPAKYPNIWHIIPDHKTCLGLLGTDTRVAIVRVIKWLPDDLGINYKYLLDIELEDHDFEVYHDGGRDAIVFQNKTLKAVIMPMFVK